ncbi:MAG: hypothetical protein DRN18_03280, partial [Thermoplasmata archaeon]
MAKKGGKKTKKKEGESKYAYKKKTAWEIFTKDQIKKAFDFCEGYKKFLDTAKTERETIKFIEESAKKSGKKVIVNRSKEAAVIVNGKK